MLATTTGRPPPCATDQRDFFSRFELECNASEHLRLALRKFGAEGQAYVWKRFVIADVQVLDIERTISGRPREGRSMAFDDGRPFLLFKIDVRIDPLDAV
jgi:hypothetical protein